MFIGRLSLVDTFVWFRGFRGFKDILVCDVTSSFSRYSFVGYRSIFIFWGAVFCRV